MNDEHRRTNVLLEQLMSQFNTFGEGLDGLRDELKDFKQEITEFKNDTTARLERIEYQNKLEHNMLKQMIDDLHTDVKILSSEVQRLDTEVVQIKRIK